MNFSYNWLQSFFKQKLPTPEKLAELLTMHFAEVEEVKKHSKDFILDIDVRPNRASDCFSHIGIAKEISAITGLNYRDPISIIKEDKNIKARNYISIEVQHKFTCSRYTARVVCDVKVGSSPKWLQERLEACGLRPINNIVDITNYAMLEIGQPLHAFDFEKIGSVNPSQRERSSLLHFIPLRGTHERIIVRFAKEGEQIITLDEQKFNLNEDILVIADSKKPIAIAGIKGGKGLEIDEKTKIVILESANFNPQTIRQSSKKLKLKTDASLRFEHGIDQNLTEIAINRAAYLIQEIAKGKTAKGLIDFYPVKILPKTIKLNLNYVRSLLGVKISDKEIKGILGRLGFKIKVKSEKLKAKTKNSKMLEAEIPTRRLDVSIQEDLIEEIGRIYGYEKIKPIFPATYLAPPKRNLDIFWEDVVKNIFKELRFSEVYNYSFFGDNEKKIFGYQVPFLREGTKVKMRTQSSLPKEQELIELENPLNQEQKYLRASLIPNLLKNIEKNLRSAPQIKIFEMGKVFANQVLQGRMQVKKRAQFSSPPKKEEKLLTGVMTGDAFYEAKGIIDLLLNKLGISNFFYDEYRTAAQEEQISWWHPKKAAEIKINGERIGFLGEISPRILEEFKIKTKVIYFDIFFEKLSKIASEEHEYRPISAYPAAVRDIAVLVPRDVRVEEILNKIEIAGGPLVRDTDLFDIYEGEELPEGKKNLAFHIIFQSEEKTLSSKEIDELQNKIIAVLEQESEWQVRK
ncbi:MAG: phenylalanine--tRNA ligase subunit beta [bacterium]|nr:phenylalanine--tRNA ligase subunit beta [bacterium]